MTAPRKRNIQRKPFPSLVFPDGSSIRSTGTPRLLPVGIKPWDGVTVDPLEGLVEEDYTGWEWIGLQMRPNPLVHWQGDHPDDLDGDD